MQDLKILNGKEIKKFKVLLEKEFSCALKGDYAYLKNEKDKVFIINKDISKINFDNLKVDRFGLYFAEWNDEQVRLSKEGAQLLAGKCQNHVKGIVELDKSETRDYFHGKDILKDLGETSRQVILTHAGNILGCARYKERTIINFLPKIYRREVIV